MEDKTYKFYWIKIIPIRLLQNGEGVFFSPHTHYHHKKKNYLQFLNPFLYPIYKSVYKQTECCTTNFIDYVCNGSSKIGCKRKIFCCNKDSLHCVVYLWNCCVSWIKKVGNWISQNRICKCGKKSYPHKIFCSVWKMGISRGKIFLFFSIKN